MYANYWVVYMYSLGNVLLPKCFPRGVAHTSAKGVHSPRAHPLVKWTYMIVSLNFALIIADAITFGLVASEDTSKGCKQYHPPFLALEFLSLLVAFSPSVLGLRRNEIKREPPQYPPAETEAKRRASNVARRTKRRSGRESVVPDASNPAGGSEIARGSVAGKRMSIGTGGKSPSVSTSVLYRDPALPVREANTLVEFVRRRRGDDIQIHVRD